MVTSFELFYFRIEMDEISTLLPIIAHFDTVSRQEERSIRLNVKDG